MSYNTCFFFLVSKSKTLFITLGGKNIISIEGRERTKIYFKYSLLEQSLVMVLIQIGARKYAK